MFLRISQYISKASLKLVSVKHKNLIIVLNMKISPKKVLKCKKSKKYKFRRKTTQGY